MPTREEQLSQINSKISSLIEGKIASSKMPSTQADALRRYANVMPSEQTPEQKSTMSVKTDVQKDVMKRIAKLQGLIPVLDQFDAALESVPVSTGMEGRAQAFGKSLMGITQIDPFVSTIQSQQEALRPQIARGFGDVGNLSTVEQKTAGKFIPRVEDAADTRILKTLGGLTFIKRKLLDSITRSGLDKDEDIRRTLSELDTRIDKALEKAKKLKIDEGRVKKFLGKENIEEDSFPVGMFGKGEQQVNQDGDIDTEYQRYLEIVGGR